MTQENKDERKKAFIVFASCYYGAMKHLNLEEKGELFELLGRYSLEGEDVHSNNGKVDLLLEATKPNMDAAEKRHKMAVENGTKGKAFGKLGGRPRKNESGIITQLNNPQITPNIPLNNDKYKDIDKDIDIEIDKHKDIENYIEKNIDRYIDRYIERNRERDRKNNTDSLDSGLNEIQVNYLTDPIDIYEEPTYPKVEEDNLIIDTNDHEDLCPDERNVFSIQDLISQSEGDNNETSQDYHSEDCGSHSSSNEMSIYDYNNGILNKWLLELVDIKKNNRPHNDELFYKTADLYKYLVPSVKDMKEACRIVNTIIDAVIRDENTSEP